MRRSPEGVAIGVSGEAQTESNWHATVASLAYLQLGAPMFPVHRLPAHEHDSALAPHGLSRQTVVCVVAPIFGTMVLSTQIWPTAHDVPPQTTAIPGVPPPPPPPAPPVEERNEQPICLPQSPSESCSHGLGVPPQVPSPARQEQVGPCAPQLAESSS
jgi:hypothetical protein